MSKLVAGVTEPLRAVLGISYGYAYEVVFLLDVLRRLSASIVSCTTHDLHP
jgi:hypothetical protein